MSYINQITPAAETKAETFCSPIKEMEALSMRLTEAKALVTTIDNEFFSNILERTDTRIDKKLADDADRLICLLPILRRELTGMSEALGDLAHRMRMAETRPGLSEWQAAFELYRAAEAVDITNMPDDDAEKAADVESDALQSLVRMRSPTVAALYEKLKILRRTDTFINEGFVDQLVYDAEALASAQEA